MTAGTKGSATPPKLRELAEERHKENQEKDAFRRIAPVSTQDHEIAGAIAQARKFQRDVELQKGTFDPTAPLALQGASPAARALQLPRWALPLAGPPGPKGWRFYGMALGVAESEWLGGFGFKWQDAENVRTDIDDGRWLPVNREAPFNLASYAIDGNTGGVVKRLGGTTLVLMYADWGEAAKEYGDRSDIDESHPIVTEEGKVVPRQHPRSIGQAARVSSERLRAAKDSAGNYETENLSTSDGAIKAGDYAVMNPQTQEWTPGNEDGAEALLDG